MKEIKSTYNKNVIRTWLFKIVLFFSVFAFSGFNSQIQDTFHQANKTELVESRNCKLVQGLKIITRTYYKTPFVSQSSSAKSFNIWTLLNFNKILELKFKSYRKKILLYNPFSIKILFKILSSSSEDEILPLSVS